MKCTLVSNDQDIIDLTKQISARKKLVLTVFSRYHDTLELVSQILSLRPNLLMVDDDLTQPESGRILKAVYPLIPNLTLIFLTSTTSMELGREISRMGIDYYGIKPLDHGEFLQAVESIVKDKSPIHSNFN